MASRELPGLGLQGDWADGDDDWGTGMNSNLATLSAMSQLAVASITAPLPDPAADGVVTVDPGTGQIKVRDAGTWHTYTPKNGWSAWVEDAAERVVYLDGSWVAQSTPGAVSDIYGAGLALRIATADILLSTGKVVSVPGVVPDGSLIVGVSARTLTDVTGTASIYLDVGTTGVWGNQYTGTSGLGISAGSTRGFCAPYSPQYAQYGALAINACVQDNTADNFTGGTIRVSVSFLQMLPPSA